MKNKGNIAALGLLLVMGLGAVGLLLGRMGEWQPTARPAAALAQPAQAAGQSAPAQSGAAQVAGDYSGVVKLQVTVAGLFSDTLPPPPTSGTPDLGTIDLSLSISQNGNALSGYVSLDKTLVFSAEHTIQNAGATLKIGPYVNGTFDGTNLTLLSERVSTLLTGQTIQRQFRLSGAISQINGSQSDGSQISGEYRETLWGAARQPVTVMGTFTLQRVVFDNSAPDTSNKTPDTVADTAITTQGAAVTINVLANDTDANGDALTITSVSKPQFGTATTDGQSVTYTPNATFVGNDSFSYFVSDGKGAQAAGSVTVTVNGANGPNQSPTAGNDNVGTTPGTALTINVLGNDSDPNGDALLITIDSQPQHGTAVVQNGQIVYTPQAGYTGTDNFTYIVSDGKGGTATATVTVNVTSTGQPGVNPLYLPLIRR